jgi:hypothetical protein
MSAVLGEEVRTGFWGGEGEPGFPGGELGGGAGMKVTRARTGKPGEEEAEHGGM